MDQRVASKNRLRYLIFVPGKADASWNSSGSNAEMLDPIKERGDLRRHDMADLKQIGLLDIFSGHDSPTATYAEARLASAGIISKAFSIPGNDFRTCAVGHGRT